MAAITVENVSKRYGTVTALDRVDLTVDEGEIFGFLGPNGAGKSTLINVFLDFAQPDIGRAAIFGHDCQAESVAVKSRMGVLPDGYTVYDRLTGRQVLVRAIGLYVALDRAWIWLVDTIVAVLFRFNTPSPIPDWAVALQLASPSEAYRHLVAVRFEFDSTHAHLAAEAPSVVNSWTALLVLAGWILGPVAIGYLRFRNTDL